MATRTPEMFQHMFDQNMIASEMCYEICYTCGFCYIEEIQQSWVEGNSLASIALFAEKHKRVPQPLKDAAEMIIIENKVSGES